MLYNARLLFILEQNGEIWNFTVKETGLVTLKMNNLVLIMANLNHIVDMEIQMFTDFMIIEILMMKITHGMEIPPNNNKNIFFTVHELIE